MQIILEVACPMPNALCVSELLKNDFRKSVDEASNVPLLVSRRLSIMTSRYFLLSSGPASLKSNSLFIPGYNLMLNCLHR
jgi:hypothetical protein